MKREDRRLIRVFASGVSTRRSATLCTLKGGKKELEREIDFHIEVSQFALSLSQVKCLTRRLPGRRAVSNAVKLPIAPLVL